MQIFVVLSYYLSNNNNWEKSCEARKCYSMHASLADSLMV